MQMVPFVRTVAASIFALALSACDGEKTENNKVILTGRWEVASATRNAKPTQTLHGTYFYFGPDGKMSTNLPTLGGENMDYEVVKKEIHQKSPLPITYLIKDWSDSSLVLTTEIRAMQFEMHLRHAPDSLSAPGATDTLPANAPDSMQ